MLKSYQFTRINEHGATENCYVSIRKQTADYSAAVFEVYFTNFESVDEKLTGSNPRADLVLTLEGNSFLAKAMTPILLEEVGLPFLFVFSNRIWALALQNPFIDDYSLKDENGKRICAKRSLADLEAVEMT